MLGLMSPIIAKFQSTLPVGGATQTHNAAPQSLWYFNPRSPWGERQLLAIDAIGAATISIHAPRGGSDQDDIFIDAVLQISIHAPRGGSDNTDAPYRLAATISIHAPRGGSDSAVADACELYDEISIHAPRGGSDTVTLISIRPTFIDFNPRSPWGERRV